MKKFDIPLNYRSGIIGALKERRKQKDPRKKDFEPTELNFGPLSFILPRHFGFCYGVENAIEISYKAISENPGKRLFLLSEMIHNPAVNEDLNAQGIRFMMDSDGHQIIPWDELTKEDVIITPAFGTTVEIEKLLADKGLEIQRYNTTCPFVEKVWKRSAEIGQKGFTIIIHGKYKHEETRATFSHSYQNAPSIIIRDMAEAHLLAEFIQKKRPREDFYKLFEGKYSDGFDPEKDLQSVGVVNQTTMLATETQAISDYFKSLMNDRHGENYKTHFADTRDTLCYATNDNQQATNAVLNLHSDLAIVVGGYNSSNTSQIVTILSEKMPTYFICNENEIASRNELYHFIYSAHERRKTTNWLPDVDHLRIVLTSGASCPDTVLEAVMHKILNMFSDLRPAEEVIQNAFA